MPNPDFDTIIPKIQDDLDILEEFFNDNLVRAQISKVHKLPVTSNCPLTTELETSSNQKFQVLIDTGAECSLLSNSTFQSLSTETYEQNPNIDLNLYDVQGRTIPQTNTPINLHLKVGDKTISHPFLIVATTDLVGLDFLQQHSVSVLNKDNSTQLHVEVGENWSNFEPKNSTIKAVSKVLYLDQHEISPGFTEIKGSCPLKDGAYEIDQNPDDSLGFPGIVHVKDHSFETIVENRTISSINIEQNQAVATINEMQDYPPKFPISESEFQEEMDQIEPRCENVIADEANITYDWESDLRRFDHVSGELIESLIKFIKEECPTLISKSNYDFGKLAERYNVKLHIRLKKDAVPKILKPYNLDAVRQKALDNHLKKMLDLDLYEHTTDIAFASPIFVVPKRDKKSYRVITDTRYINSQCENQDYPLRDPNSIIESLSEHRPNFFSVFDLRNCFDSVMISEESRKYLVIVTKDVALSPKRMCQGSKLSPSVWLCAMSKIANEVKAILPPKAAFNSYFDDCCLSTVGSVEEHLETVKKVFVVLNNAGLKLNCAKIQLCRTQVSLLGKVIDRFGTSPDPRHHKAIENFPRPNTIKQVMSFLGTMNFLSNCIYNFSKIILPLVKLLRKGEKFHWGKDQEDSFVECKLAVSNAIKIYLPMYDSPVYIIHDASKYHWSGILYQIKSYGLNEIEGLRSDLFFNESFTKKGSRHTAHPVLPPNPRARKLEDNSVILSPISKAIEHEKQLKARELKKAFMSNDKDTVEGKGPVAERPSVNLLMERLEKQSSVLNYLQQGELLHLIMPIGVRSGTLSKTASHWTPLEIESFALFTLANKFSHILTVCPKTIFISDCLALVYLTRIVRTQTTPPSKLVRWFQYFSQLPFLTITHHCAGSTNPADLLSRPYGSLAFKVKEEQSKLSAITVVSPFKFGKLVTLEELDEYITDLVSQGYDPVSYREQKKPSKICSSISVKPIHKIGSITVENIKPLADLFELANIRNEQLLDSHTRSFIDNPNRPNNIIMSKGLLHKLVKLANTGEVSARIYLPESLQIAVLSYLHWGSHISSRGLIALCSSMYYFPRMQKIALKFTASCYLCQISKVDQHSLTKLLPTAYDASPRNYCWSLDIISGFSPYKGSDQILIMMERCTRYTIATWLPRATGLVVRRVIEEKLISLFTPPHVMSSDQGSQLLLNKNVSEMLGYYGITTSVSTPYASFAHGAIERRNLVFSDLLRILTKQFNTSWYSLLPQINLFMNLSPLDCLGNLTPAYCLIGAEINQLQQPISESQIRDPEALKSFWKVLNTIVASRSASYHKRNQSQREHSKGKIRKFPPGSFVFYKKMAKAAHSKHKSRYFLAPVLVVSEWQNSVLMKRFDGTLQYCHKRFLKPCRENIVKMYSTIPLKSRFACQDVISLEVLKSYMDLNTLPDFFTENKPLRRSRPVTRLKTPPSKLLDYPLKELTEHDLFVDDNILHEMSSDDDDLDDDDIPDVHPAPRTVQFAVTE